MTCPCGFDRRLEHYRNAHGVAMHHAVTCPEAVGSQGGVFYVLDGV